MGNSKPPLVRSSVADAPPENWVERYAPAWARPYFILARFDRPIGSWLLFWPGAWGIALFAPTYDWTHFGWPLILFGLGAVVMRGAGCVMNDLADRNLDGRVARTRNRPLASGQLRPWQALLWMGFLSTIGLAILLQFNGFAVMVGAASLGLIALYPFMKRITWWPQFFLGITFNWGALLSEAAVRGTITGEGLLLYVAGIFWTLGYDTIYAHQDREDDALVGIKSTARLFGQHIRPWVGAFYAATILLLLALPLIAKVNFLYYAGLALAAGHLAWQILRFDQKDGGMSLRLFRSNRDAGLLIALAVLLGRL